MFVPQISHSLYFVDYILIVQINMFPCKLVAVYVNLIRFSFVSSGNKFYQETQCLIVSLFTLAFVDDQYLDSLVEIKVSTDKSKFYNVFFIYQMETSIKEKFPSSNIWFISFKVSILKAL